ncbi:oxygen-binding di-iron domain-containing protein [Kangiella shandongensis]|uniref:MBL fold metallo-hydrolase n=1 Tax=Kangiella shandongensis TaxID=2763258 RepID=UPI001CC139A9|nr:MBL fold metallo-hydrolase [Kangiella shandongensis]
MFSTKATELYNDGHHKCYAFHELVAGEAVQANQFLIVNGDKAALIDPGGDLTFAKLSIELNKLIDLRQGLKYIVASHQDPDIIASIGRWMMQTDAKVVCSKLWQRFLPHFASSYFSQIDHLELGKRIKPLDDRGEILSLGSANLVMVPAHFLHSVGNFQVYDPVSKILFSGDMGASLKDSEHFAPVESFIEHTQYMKGFHQRYMVANKTCKLWANMIRDLDVEMIVPQHGAPFKGKKVVSQFLDWISELDCGVDLFSQRDYTVPV